MTTTHSAGLPRDDLAPRPARKIASPLAGLLLCAALLGLAGCTSMGPHSDPRDPLEPFNRGVTQFNDDVDAMVLKPVAIGYEKVTPALVRTGVSNFFANLGDAWSFVNNVLQLRAEGALNSLVRFNVNTFFGLGGVLDIASEMGVDRHRQDFGLTLGRWGVPPGAYVVLPLLGPSTVRDTLALPVDWEGYLLTQVRPVSLRNSLYGLRAVDTRANLLRASTVLDTAALDKYSFTRDVYLRLRGDRSEPPGRASGEDDSGSSDGRLPDEPY